MAQNGSDSDYAIDCTINFATPTFNFAGKLTYLEKLIFITLIAVFGVVIILGNSLVIIAYQTSKKVREINFNFYIVNLAIVDLLIGTLSTPVNILSTVVHNQDQFRLYIFYGQFLTGASMFASATLQIAMSYDRYVLVTEPLKYRNHTSRRKTRKLVIFLWLYSAMAAVSSIVSHYILYSVSSSCFQFPLQEIVNIIFYIHNFLLPVTVLVTLNLLIFVKLSIRFRAYKRKTSVPTVSKSITGSRTYLKSEIYEKVELKYDYEHSSIKILQDNKTTEVSLDQVGS